MSKVNFGFIQVLLCLSNIFLSAQSFLNYKIEIINEESGLSNIGITSLTQDKDGYIWISTRNGLNRYDGRNFKIFKNKEGDSLSLVNTFEQLVHKDIQGHVWVSYNSNKISRYLENCECFATSTIRDSVTSVIKRGLGRLFFLSESTFTFTGYNVGFNIYNYNTGSFDHWDLSEASNELTSQEKELANSITDFHITPDGMLWIATRFGLYTFNYSVQKVERVHLFYNKNISEELTEFWHMIHMDDESIWIVGKDSDLCHYNYCNNHTEVFHTYPDITKSLYKLRGLAIKSENEIWLTGYPFGLATFNTKSHQFQFIDKSECDNKFIGLSSLNSILKLKDSTLFITSEYGLIKISPANQVFNFNRIDTSRKQELFQNEIHSICPFPEKSITLFTTDNPRKCIVLNDTSQSKTVFDLDVDISIAPKYRSRVLINPGMNKKFWIMTNFSLYQYDYNRNSIRRLSLQSFRRKYPNSEFKSIFTDLFGKIWIITNDGTIHQFNESKEELSDQLIPSNSSIESLEPMNFIRLADKNKFWILYKKQIALYNTDNNTLQWPLDSLAKKWITSDFVYATTDLENNLYAIVNGKGIIKIERNSNDQITSKTFTVKDGLPTTSIYDVKFDHRGKMWLCTTLGIYRYDLEENTFRHFKESDGLPAFTMRPFIVKNDDNSFYLICDDTYSKVDFNKLEKKENSPRIYIEKVLINESERLNAVLNDTFLTLSPQDKFISIDFGSIDFGPQKSFSYAYQMENWDRDWIYCGNRNYTSYSNLEPGQYTFKVKVTGLNGEFGEPIKVNLFIEKVFYKKVWFIGLIGLMLIGIISSVYKYRINQIRNTEKIKNEFNTQLADMRMEALRAQMNPHFIFNCLNSINRFIIKSDIRTSSHYLTRFAKLMRLILDNSKNKIVVLTNELEALKLYMEMEAMRFDQKFTFEINISLNVNPDNIEIPPLIIQPYVENAIWHGLLPKESPGKITIDVDYQDPYLIIEIVDNGIGREKAMEFKSLSNTTRKSLGIKLTEDRLKMASENISITGSQKIIDLYDKNGLSCGTKVIINLPV